MLLGLLGYMIVAFFSFPKERPVHSVFLALIAACIVASYQRSFPSRGILNRKTFLHGCGATLLILSLCTIVWGVRLDSEFHTRLALTAREKGDWQAVISEIDKVESLFYSLDPTATPVLWYRGSAYFYIGEFSKALTDFQKAYEDHPNHVHVLNNLASAYAKTAEYNNAVTFYLRTMELCPAFEMSRINLGLLYKHLLIMKNRDDFFLENFDQYHLKQVLSLEH
jgi:tetratricopeptide (TPR) repeat protein